MWYAYYTLTLLESLAGSAIATYHIFFLSLGKMESLYINGNLSLFQKYEMIESRFILQIAIKGTYKSCKRPINYYSLSTIENHIAKTMFFKLISY